MEESMILNIVANWRDRKGLWRDGCLLEALLLQWGLGMIPHYVDFDNAGLYAFALNCARPFRGRAHDRANSIAGGGVR
jgi:hypothetical protein